MQLLNIRHHQAKRWHFGSILVAGALLVAAALTFHACRSRPRTYTVTPGDTGYAIAVLLEVPFSAIDENNPDVDWKRLQPGQKLLIPKVTSRNVDHPHHIVRFGDTGTSIASEHQISFRRLFDENPELDWYPLSPGTRVRLPEVPSEPSAQVASNDLRAEIAYARRNEEKPKKTDRQSFRPERRVEVTNAAIRGSDAGELPSFREN